MIVIEDLVDADYTFICPYCSGPASLSAYGGSGIGIRCDDYECDGYIPGEPLFRLWEESGVVFDSPPDEWVERGSGEIKYSCPECGSNDMERHGYDDGLGYVDVKVKCNDCSFSTWE